MGLFNFLFGNLFVIKEKKKIQTPPPSPRQVPFPSRIHNHSLYLSDEEEQRRRRRRNDDDSNSLINQFLYQPDYSTPSNRDYSSPSHDFGGGSGGGAGASGDYGSSDSGSSCDSGGSDGGGSSSD